MLIPQWSHQGIIPPIDENDPTAFERAPYLTNVEQVVERFSTTIERCEILHGFLSHRAEMHRIGIVSGFQWLNGSFMEHVELLEGRAPNDMDVVTFADIRSEVEAALTPDDLKVLTGNEWIKHTYKVDFYLIPLSEPAEFLVEMSAYWYSMWSHRRSQQWKGFLSVRLEPDHDDNARRLLENRKREVQNEQN